MSLCTRTLLQTSRRQAISISKPALLNLTHQYTTEIHTPTPPFHETAPSPPPPVQAVVPSDVDAGVDTPVQKMRKGGRRKPTRHADGKVKNTTLENLSFTCYQEALKILEQDRKETLVEIQEQWKSIVGLKRLHGYSDDNPRIMRMKAHMDKLKLNIDKNNPRIKYNYDNKIANRDLSRPIYLLWDDEKWRSYRRKVLMQRIEQMNIVPDVLPKINPIVDVHMKFGRSKLPLGGKVEAKNALHHPYVRVNQFDDKKRLVTVVVVDADKPNLEKNGFDFYLQWMVTNCPVSIESPVAINVGVRHDGRDEVAPYEVPYVYKGENYHRYCVFVLEQEGRLDIGKTTENAAATSNPSADASTEGFTPESSTATTTPDTSTKTQTLSKPQSKEERIKRLGFNLRSFIAKNNLKVIGAHLWRCEFDDSMIQVMKKLGRTDWGMKYVKHPEHI
ncbi:hypothetical protein TWF694_002491 [Orbilia ellipsospora]|uniref:PEBP-like protein n=1 Tax=Orbilia ellipsospora TaxID=2528407 RepID=A0AAV9X3C9_9PEZI